MINQSINQSNKQDDQQRTPNSQSERGSRVVTGDGRFGGHRVVSGSTAPAVPGSRGWISNVSRAMEWTAVRPALLCAAAFVSFVFVFGTGADFVRFVSFRAIYHNITGGAPLCGDAVPWSVALRDGEVLRALGVDLALLALFSVQHSLLAWAPVKKACQSALGVLNRAMYCSTTALTLQVLMRWWQPVTSAPCLWSVRSAPWDIWFPLICFVVHFLCWAIICSILLIFDYPELLGLKQVYYECLGLGDPLLLKSPRAQRLYAHLRHPVCVELLLVLWLLPTLPLDRCVLAAYLSLYLALAHSLDAQDCAYLSAQLHSKLQLFSAPQGGAAHINSNNSEQKQD